jgi:hypothetical protein
VTPSRLVSQLPILYGADCLERVQPLLVERYDSVVNSIWSGLPSTQAAPTVHVIHSPFAQPTSVFDADGRHLVYDQYLGQLFNRLTRIELLEADPRIVDSYVLKIFGQRNLIRGKASVAGALADVAGSIAAPSEIQRALAESEDVLGVRVFVASVQEEFAIGHELIHALINDGEAEPLRADFELVLEEHSLHMARATDPELRQEFLERAANFIAADAVELARCRGQSVADPSSLQPSSDDVEEQFLRYSTLASKLTDPTLVEEAMCDYYGAIGAADNVTSDDAARPLVYAAAALGLLHLRFIQYLDALIDGAETSEAELQQSVLRASILRTALRGELLSRHDGRELAAEFDQLATEFNRMHARVVLDQALQFDLRLFAGKIVNGSDGEPDADLVRQALGFGRVPHFTRQQAEALVEMRNDLSRDLIDRIVEAY